MNDFTSGAGEPDPELLAVAKLGVIVASTTAAIIGLAGGRLLLHPADSAD